MRGLTAMAVLGGLGAVTQQLPSQTMRVYSGTRAVGSEKALTASIDFGAGEVVIQPGTLGLLYSVRLRYDADRFVPTQQYDMKSASVKLGLTSIGGTGIKVTSRAQLAQSGVFEFSADVPLSLTANLGASEATLNLGGMMLRELTVHNGASRTSVNFSRPTRGECTKATFSVGATELDIENLAQSGCRHVRIEGGVGSVVADFGGIWRGNTELVVELAMGSLTLVIPTGTGVQIDGERFLSPIESKGFTHVGSAWVTPGWEKAVHRLQVQLKTALAGIEVKWKE